MNALSIVTIGGLALVFLMYFNKGFCDTTQTNGGAFCFRGFSNLATDLKGGVNELKNQPAGASSAPAPIAPISAGPTQLKSRFGGGGCKFTGPSTVCWVGDNGQSVCNSFNAKSSNAATVSGRQTLCSRVRAKSLAQHMGMPASNLSYVGQRLSVA